jgi:uncharacterized protein (TIGR02611 family)
MLDKIKRSWRRLKAGKPGHRFQAQYKEQQKARRPAWARPVWMAAGTVVMAVGVVALPAPGPGFLVIGLGAALLARESLIAARALDWIELRLREAWAWLKNAWRMAPLAVKVLTVLVCSGTAVALGWVAAVWFLNRR